MLPSEKNGPAAIRQPPSSVVMNGPPFCPQALNLGCALGPFWVRGFLTWSLASKPFDSPALPKRRTCMHLVLRRTMDHAAPSPQRFANTHCSCQCACSRAWVLWNKEYTCETLRMGHRGANPHSCGGARPRKCSHTKLRVKAPMRSIPSCPRAGAAAAPVAKAFISAFAPGSQFGVCCYDLLVNK